MEVALLCERFKCLPNPGGLFQQESEHIWKLNRALQSIDEKREEEMKKEDSKIDGT